MRKQQNFKWQELSLGTCYYPEHWDKSLWHADLQRMKNHGIFTIRIAEFAWNKFEPTEGEFSYTFFDEFLDVAEAEEMKVIFCTPTATPPAWLTNKYPEVLNCRKDGVKLQHGMRRHYNYNSPVYQKFSARIVENIAAHYAKRSCIIGWQVDNELNCEADEFYSESDTIAFREFLKEKYGTINTLNDAWGTVFWNQTYTQWEEIYVPRTTINNSTNPHQTLDYYRFISASAIRFCRMQSEIVRRYVKPGDFITTNGMFTNLDNHKMVDECLDVYTFDTYPNCAFGMREDPKNNKDLNDRRWSYNLTAVRSVCPNFGIMEQQVGANGWNTGVEAPAPKPGQLMLWAMQSISHGADYVGFFRYRACTFGTEIYWHGIVDYDNRDTRKLTEIKQLWKRTQAIAETTGAKCKASFALLRDYDNLWDAQLDVWHDRLATVSEKEIFIASQLTHTPMDMVYILEDTEAEELLKYPVLFCPHALILKEKTAELLSRYVKEGGTLIIGARTGQKDQTGKCVMKPMPGLLVSVTGTDVKEYTFVGPADEPQFMNWDGKEIETGTFSDILQISDNEAEARVLAAYENDYYAGEPALIETKYGKGRILHFGGTFTRENTKDFMKYTGILSPWEEIIALPEGCELVVKEKEGKTYLFVLNYMREAQEIELKEKATDLDDGDEKTGRIVLAPFETKVYRICS